MAISEITGTEAISTTEWSLVTDTSFAEADGSTDNGMVELHLDLSDMVAGDVLQIRFYEDVRSGDTQGNYEEYIFFGVQNPSRVRLPAVTVLHQWDFTADALVGTITLNWSIRRWPDA